MSDALDKTHLLETAPIGGLLLSYALPTVVSQVIACIYNIADRIFIGQGVGSLAISGLAITLPIMNVIHAFGSLIGAGSSARMSIVLGKKDVNWAEQILGNSLLFSVVLGLIVMTGCYLFLNDILMAFGATPATIAYAREYMLLVLPGMFLTTITFNMTGLIRSTGYPRKAMFILVGGAVLNLLLDPLFIFGFGWGIRGAALATTLSMATTAIIAIWHFVQKSSFIRFKRHGWALKKYIFRNIIAIGMSPFLMNLAGSGVVAILNKQLILYGGDLAVGAYGIANTYVTFLFLFILGVCQGMQPIAGYNFGAGQLHRLRDIYLLTMRVCLIIGTTAMIIGTCMPGILARCFTQDTALIDLSIEALIYNTIMFPFIAFTVVNSQFFMSIDRPWVSIVTSLSRQVLILAPISVLFPIIYESMHLNGLTGVWLSFPVSDVGGAILAAILLYTQRQTFQEKPS